jgi:hypothetical protein
VSHWRGIDLRLGESASVDWIARVFFAMITVMLE